jgi:hypothetical protein
VTLGDIDVNCQPLVIGDVTLGSFDCYYDGAPIGVLSTSNRSYQPAYPAAKGYDFASGLGSVHVFIRSWPGSRLHSWR